MLGKPILRSRKHQNLFFAVIALLDVAINSASTLAEDGIKLQNQLFPLEKFRKHVKYSSEPIEQLVPRSSSSNEEGLPSYAYIQGGRTAAAPKEGNPKKPNERAGNFNYYRQPS